MTTQRGVSVKDKLGVSVLRAEDFGLCVHVDVTSAPSTATQTQLGVADLTPQALASSLTSPGGICPPRPTLTRAR